MKLLRYRRPVGSIFDLLGTKEDDMTYALGFVASRSSEFALRLLRAAGGPRGEIKGGIVRLQEVDGDGRTDVEIEWPKRFHVVFEAKRGPWLPTTKQLEKYVPRLQKVGAPTQRLVAVTNAPDDYAEKVLPKVVGEVPLVHLSWSHVRRLARAAKAGETNRNKYLLDEFDIYLKGILGMDNVRSNMVYVLALGSGSAWGLNFKEVATKRSAYFDPVARYRSRLPNYIAFRYDGRLQSIHHVEKAEIFENPKSMFSDAEDKKEVPHYLFRLGPPIVPSHEVKNGPSIKQANRVWCMLDLLLTSATITDALKETKRRLGDAAGDVDNDEGDE
jgi:hypothetical protein